MHLIFFGIQGSGKGTQAKLLTEKLSYVIFETGAELRKLAQEDSDLGRKVKTTIEAGHLVSPELVLEILKNFIQTNLDSQIIFDGIPRNQIQYDAFTKLLNSYNLDYTAVHFKLSRPEAERRLLERATIENRADDNQESINRRIEIFYTQTLPLIEHYNQQSKLIEIDASPDIETIHKNLLTHLN